MHKLDLENEVNAFLDSKAFSDPSYNGLQVEGRDEVKKIVTAATASLAAIDAAIEQNADALIVHHGLFWKGANPKVIGVMKNRLQALMEANLNLYAWHLPLDANASLGNNRFLLELLGVSEFDYVEPGDKTSIAMQGTLDEALSVQEICGILCSQLDTRVQIIGSASEDLLIDKVAVCTGSGSFLLDDNPRPNFEALITGEVNEQTYHFAQETGTVVFVVGHHASEQDGVRFLGEYLAQKYGLEHHHLHFTLEKDVPWFEAIDDNE